MEGDMINVENTTVKRCMKEQIPDSGIFTEIDEYIVDMKCVGKTFANNLKVITLASLAALLSATFF